MEYPKRKTNRLCNFDYSRGGAYFLTICTKDRKPMLWKSGKDACHVGENCVLPYSKLGAVVVEEIEKWSNTYTNVTIEAYVVMPNHVHLVVTIHDENGRTQFSPTVSRMVKQFKGSITKKVGASVFQRSFYDHIIRSNDEYNKICSYIYLNPVTWKDDKLYIE